MGYAGKDEVIAALNELLERVKDGRALSITSAGHRGLMESFDLGISDDLGIRRLPWCAER